MHGAPLQLKEALQNIAPPQVTGHGKKNVITTMIKRTNKKWTDELLAEEALKYSSRHAFAVGASSAYTLANRRKILDKICAHMTKKRVAWSKDLVFKVAREYETRTEFFRGDRAAYAAAQRMGIFDEACAHMPKYAPRGE